MKHFLLNFVLLVSCLAKEADYPLIATMGIGRGRYPGEYVTELRIGRTVYVSEDTCPKVDVHFGARYPARLSDRTIWLRVDSHLCKYRVSDEHPFLAHRPKYSENEP